MRKTETNHMALFGFGEDPGKIKAKKLREDGCLVVLSIEVPAEKLKAPIEDAFGKIQQKASVPGFRAGKAPKDVVRQKYAEDAKSWAVDQIIREVLPGVIEEQKLMPVSVPIVHDVEMPDGKALKFQVSLEIPPTAQAKDYKKIALTKKAKPVTDEMVTENLEQLRQRNARLVAVLTETVERDHFVLVDYEGFLLGKAMEGAKGEGEWVDMTAPQTVAGLTEGILGAKRGQVREFPVDMPGGEKANFKVTVKDIKRKTLPNLDDELAKDLGFGTLLEVRLKLREVLEKTETSKTEKDLERQIEEHLLKANPLPVPPSLVEAEAKHMIERLKSQLGVEQMSDAEAQDLHKRVLPEAENSVRLGYLLKSIGDKEQIKVLDAEFEEEEKKSLEAAQSDEEKGKVKEFFAQHRREISNIVLERKVWKFLKDSAKVKEN